MDNDIPKSTNEELLRKFLETQLQPPVEKQAKTRRRPYYNEEHAIEAKKIIDKLIDTKQPLRILADNKSVNTMRIKYYDGLAYLKDHLDPANQYAAASKLIKCATRKHGLDFYFISSVMLSDLPSATIVDWRQPLVDFLDSKPAIGAKYHNPRVILNAEDISWAEGQLVGIEELFMYKITQNEILIIRYDNQ